MIYAVTALIFFSLFLLLTGIYHVVCHDRLVIARRLGQLSEQKKMSKPLREDLQQPLTLRFGKMFWGKPSRFLDKRMSAEQRLYFQKRLQMAGNPAGLSPIEFRLLHYFSAFLLGVALAIASLLSGKNGFAIFLLFLAGLGFGGIIPELYLNMRIKARRQAFICSLPDVLDLMLVSVEAGLSFEIALMRVTERFKGVVAEECGRVVQEMKLGKPRREALKDLAERVGADELNTFIGSLIQADQLGASIGNIIRVQADQMRRKRRQRAEEQAMKAPIKMLIPLVFFIFPALFIVLLGPAIIQLMKNM